MTSHPPQTEPLPSIVAALIELHPADRQFPRRDAAHALTEAGFPTASATLATKAVRGGGPPFRRYGRRPIYRWRDLIEWALARTGPLRRSTSDAGDAP